jgi:hypothetical protein
MILQKPITSQSPSLVTSRPSRKEQRDNEKLRILQIQRPIRIRETESLQKEKKNSPGEDQKGRKTIILRV